MTTRRESENTDGSVEVGTSLRDIVPNVVERLRMVSGRDRIAEDTGSNPDGLQPDGHRFGFVVGMDLVTAAGQDEDERSRLWIS